MPKRGKPKSERRDWRWYASFVLNAFVALSMVIGTVFLFTGGSTTQSPPAITPIPTSVGAVTPTPAPAPANPTPTPTKTSLDLTPPSGAGSLTFAVAGDSRDGDVIYSKVLARVMKDGNAFLIHTGDLVGSDTTDQWANFQGLMKGFTLPFYPVPGNHDTRDGKLTAYLQYSGATAAHYSFDRANVHFTFLNSSLGSFLESEFTYLDQDLAASTAPIKMVFLHHPPFDPGGSTHIMTNGGERFMKMVKDRGVKYVFAGHIHCYEDAERDGIQYFITGGAGAPLTCPAVTGGFNHYIQVQVTGETVQTTLVKIDAE